MKIAYEHGLHELGDGLYAYLQPDGGWGWSNAGLITAGGRLAARRLAVRPEPHARHMRAAPAAAVNLLFNELDLGPEFDAFAERVMRRFDFASVTERLPTESFSGRHELRVGGRGVHLIELGARVIVPGHGPVTDESGVRDVQRYLTYVRDEARERFDAVVRMAQWSARH